MRGLLKAGVLLAPALAGAVSFESPQDSIPSAFITLHLPQSDDLATTQDLAFRFDVAESTDACGYGNVTINGQELVKSGSGSLTMDQDRVVVSSWNFTCVAWNGEPQEQLLSLNVDSVNGKPVEDVGFTIRFHQIAPVWISDIEGSASMTRVHRTSQPEEDDEMDRDLDAELAELDFLRWQLAEMQQHVFMKERELAQAFGWFHGHGGIRECDSLKCVVEALAHKVKGVAKSFYGAGGGGPHRGPPPPPPPPPPHHGHGHGNFSAPHNGSHPHHPKRPHFPPPFCKCAPPPPPPHHGGPPPHHHHGGPPPPPHHGLGLWEALFGGSDDGHGHPHGPGPHGHGEHGHEMQGHDEHRHGEHGPGEHGMGEHGHDEHGHGEHGEDQHGSESKMDKPEGRPHQKDGKPSDDSEQSSRPEKNTGDAESDEAKEAPQHEETSQKLDDPEGPFPSKPYPESELRRHDGPPPFDGPHGGPHGGPHDGPHDGPHGGPPGPHGRPPGPHGGPPGPPGPPGHHGPPPMIGVASAVASFVLFAILANVLHKRYFRRATYAERRAAFRARRLRNAEAPWYTKLCFGRFFALEDSDFEEEEEKEAMLRQGENSNSDDSDDEEGSTTMEQEISSFRTAADVMTEMVAAEEGRAHARQCSQEMQITPISMPMAMPQQSVGIPQQYQHHQQQLGMQPLMVPVQHTHQMGAIPIAMPHSPTSAFPYYHGMDEALPAYEDDRDTESDVAASLVSDGFRGNMPGTSSQYTPSDSGSADDILGDTKN